MEDFNRQERSCFSHAPLSLEAPPGNPEDPGFPALHDEVFRIGDLRIALNRQGAKDFLKLSVPLCHGRYHEIETPGHRYQFNLNGEVKYIRGRRSDWPHPAEWLKRTLGNDWIYYSVGSYNDVFDLIGEYYFPCVADETSPFFRHRPFAIASVQEALRGLDPLLEKLDRWGRRTHPPKPLQAFLRRIISMASTELKRRGTELHRILGERITVLPPDSRHVDYAVIPVVIARGCLYHCGFCRFKSRQPFTRLTQRDVQTQLVEMKAFLRDDLPNYNAVFLGQHDALSAGAEMLLFAAEKAYEIFELHRSSMKDTWLFLFGSVDAVLAAEEHLFETLERLPYRVFINLGLESMDSGTLDALKKPVEASRVKAAYLRMLDINRRYPTIEVTANFVLGKALSAQHRDSLLALLESRVSRRSSKGAIYLSPLNCREPKTDILSVYTAIKRASKLPVWIYPVQGL